MLLGYITLLSFLLSVESSNIWIDVPFVKQEANGCGAASIAMVMQYWAKQNSPVRDDGANPHAIHRILYTEEKKGVLASDMEHYFQSHGFRTFLFQSQWQDLRQHLSMGRPLILCIQKNKKKESLHYIVAVGLNDQENTLLVNDPAEKKLRKLDRVTFEEAWKAMNYWTLLAVPK